MFTGCNLKKTVLNTIINKSISSSRTVEHIFSDQVIDGTVVEMVSEIKILCVRYSRLKVSLREASQSNSCFCHEEGWYFEEDDECFSRCCCCCQMLLGIHTPCARVLFSSLDIRCHFPPVVA